jgi:DNA-binding transcriptional ArsR family regulator
MEMNSAIAALEALGHETRLGVFRLLVRAGPDGLPAGAIAEELDALQNTLSNHLNKLSTARLVTGRRRGRQIIYSANFDALSGLILYLVEDCCGGNAAVCESVRASISC